MNETFDINVIAIDSGVVVCQLVSHLLTLSTHHSHRP